MPEWWPFTNVESTAWGLLIKMLATAVVIPAAWVAAYRPADRLLGRALALLD